MDPPRTCDCCGTRLHRALVRAGFARHPGCDPDEEAWDWRDGTLRPVEDVRPLTPWTPPRGDPPPRPVEDVRPADPTMF